MKEVEIWRYTSLLSPIPYLLSPIPSSTSKGVMEEQKIKGRDLYDTYFVTSEENHELHGEPRFAELREQKFQEEDQPLMHDIKDSEEIYDNII